MHVPRGRNPRSCVGLRECQNQLATVLIRVENVALVDDPI